MLSGHPEIAVHPRTLDTARFGCFGCVACGIALSTVERDGLSLAKHKMHLRTTHRPARIKVAGIWLAAEDDLTLLGLSAVTGGPSEYERRTSRA